MNLELSLRTQIQKAFTTLFNSSVEAIQMQPTNQEFEGSVTVVCFPLTKISKKGPEETAKLLGDQLVAASGLVSRYNVVKGFLNLVISDEAWLKVFTSIASEKNFGVQPPNGKEIMVEYSSPNTNKPLHLGHLRNNFLGWSVAELFKANGYKVHKVQIINDRGIHICKSMAAWKRFGNGETPESSGIKGDHLVGKYYVAFDKELKKQLRPLIDEIEKGDFSVFNERETKEIKGNLDQLSLLETKLSAADDDLKVMKAAKFLNETSWKNLAKTFEDPAENTESKSELQKRKDILTRLRPLISLEDKIDERLSVIGEIASNKTVLMGEAQELLRQWEAKDPETVKLWQTMNNWVYQGFDVTYKRMGIDFEKLYYESDTYLLGKEQVLKGVESGVFFKKEDGSVWVDLTADGLDQKLLLRSDGTSVYMTQDIGTAILRFNDFPEISRQVYTVGNEQEYHFKVLFLILAKLGYGWAKECYHLSYGMVDLPTGKMKSREGTVVDADDLMEEMVGEAGKQARELGKIEDFTVEQFSDLSEMVGVGALKYYLLKVDPRKRMMFDPNESIQLQGHTGPFIQYTHARIRAILRKAKEMGVTPDGSSGVTELAPAEREVIRLINAYPGKIADAAKDYSPSLIANYAYDLAREYNQFYQSIPIFNETDTAKMRFRIAFSEIVATTLGKAMGLLGIHVPDRM